MGNISDAGITALAEAGCGAGLRRLILGAVWLCPFCRIVGFALCQGAVTSFSLEVFFLRFSWLASREMSWLP